MRTAGVKEEQITSKEEKSKNWNVLQLTTSRNDGFYNRQLESLERAGFEQQVLMPPGQYKAIEASRSIADYCRFLPQVRSEISESYDLIHANYGLTAPFALAQTKLPTVLSLWGSDLYGKYGWLSKYCAQKCDAVIVMSQEMKEKIDRDQNCYVISHGLDLEQFQPMDQKKAQTEINWDADKYHVLFPYNTKRKVKNYSKARRVVSSTRQNIDKKIELHTIHGHPHFRVPIYMNASDVLLLTSDREGFPNTVKEALACNLPVVATDVGDVSDCLSNVSSSFVCHSEAELVQRLTTVLSNQSPSNGRKVVQSFSLERVTEQICDVYREVVN